MEELRQKLQEVEIGTALSQADSNFLQRELEEKEADIGEKNIVVKVCPNIAAVFVFF